MTEERLAQIWRALRNAILFLSGLAGVAYETIVKDAADLGLLAIYAVMMGLPALFQGVGNTMASRDEIEKLKEERDKAVAMLNAQSEITQRLFAATAKLAEAGGVGAEGTDK